MSVLIIAPMAFAETFDPAVDGLIQNQQRQAELNKIINPTQDVNLDTPQKKPVSQLREITDSQCFNIHNIHISGEQAKKFRVYLQQAVEELGFRAGMCMGEQRINLLMTRTQNIIIGKGYTTTRILAAAQDLSKGSLNLTVVPGFVHAIKLDLNDQQSTHAGRIQYAKNIFPIKAGDILNLRALEQGLENLKRVPTVEADIQIVPADAPNQSDVIVKWRQRTVPVRLTLSADDAGSRQTGKYQGNVTISLDNPLFRSDLFYITLGRNLADQSEITDQNDHRVKGRTTNYALHYSVPYKNWLISSNASQYQYHQAVAGTNNVYDYSGETKSQDIGLTRLLYRDAKRKTSVTVKGWHTQSNNYIDDAELTVQRREVAGWQLNLDHREYIKNATLDLGLGYKRGTGALDAQPVPEESVGEGTSRMKIWTVDANLQVPFQLGTQSLNYSSALHGQYNDTPLSAQDRLAIGGRYTVRGFDGDLTLSAERGWYWRNDLALAINPSHQFYMALDAGHVGGPSAQWLLGQTLVGAAMGFRGQIKVGGNLYYDVFAGKPLKKPDYFQNYDMNFGFSTSYSF
ncbi:ShlB/FhaC/HecB family hemolysin secretion/activation protein [Acinetobacter sp. MD2(2019)]|uniref:ShlB/FhaC/HecB family hemolysin secretion/activation protein n=1 Tax=Acinetobacter sp. MD2(2019) TaxID=2605273 RepID=UPI002D1F6F73|nr:ShlB/FhaC/HecB family hemolysin secretion/activation protein [Acinetobacter sp. MD2(2019)]MEB3755112.1 ShlB/FhaC/HecB family hemolysin secretion/activation protein [Acinetobacter sp. MD2(2019)]